LIPEPGSLPLVGNKHVKKDTKKKTLMSAQQKAKLLGISQEHFCGSYRQEAVPSLIESGHQKYGWSAGTATDYPVAKGTKVNQMTVIIGIVPPSPEIRNHS
jgi:hypothetical protein